MQPALSPAELADLVTRLLWGAFAIGALFGALSQRTHFCTMGAVADIVSMGDWSRMRMWLLAMATALIGFNALVALGWLHAADTLYAAPQMSWLSNLLGGLLFGAGMVLASGCGGKTLVRAGGGNLKSVVVFVVLAVAAYATLRGVVGLARVRWIDPVAITFAGTQDLPSLLSRAGWGSAPRLAAGLGLGLGAALMLAVAWRPEGRRAEVWLAGVGVGALVVAGWWLSGHAGFVAEHPETLEPTFLATNSHRAESLTFVSPIAYTVDWLILASDRSKVLTLGIASVLGVVAGSAASALATRSFRWEGFASAEDTALHLGGAVLMGVGGVLAVGCTIGQGLSGLSTLSLGSFIALAGILTGAWAALRWQTWRLERLP